MGKKISTKSEVWLVCSVTVNMLFMVNMLTGRGEWSNLSWTKRAAKEAEEVAAISCSGHGRAYLDGMVIQSGNGNEHQLPICECNSCYGGTDCSIFYPSCSANVDGGDPLFLEPFWMQHASSSALVVAGWHRMSYSFSDQTVISKQLEMHIRKLHTTIGNAVTKGRYIIFGAGSTQLLNAAVHALSPNNSSSPARVAASIPFYPVYEKQTDFFQSVCFKFEGDTSLWKNNSNSSTTMVEFVTSPNNPDGQLKSQVLYGPNVKTVYDHAYYWPHFTPIPSPADTHLMIFTLSKLTGHAGSRFGWAVIKDEAIYRRMSTYLTLNTMGVSRDTQLRALKLLKVVLQSEGRDLFEFGHEILRKRWQILRNTLSLSKRFSLQKIETHYCTFSHKVREASPAYAWVKCEKEEDEDCHGVLAAAGITGRRGSVFFVEDRYVRLSLIRSQDDIDLMLHKLNKLVSDEVGPKIM